MQMVQGVYDKREIQGVKTAMQKFQKVRDVCKGAFKVKQIRLRAAFKQLKSDFEYKMSFKQGILKLRKVILNQKL